MNTYTPSGNSGPGALAMMIGIGFIGTLGTAVVGGFITRWLDLIILFAMVMGVGAGFAVKSGARRGHCRNRTLIAAVAILMGLLVYGGKLFANYRNERRTTVANLEQKLTIDPKDFAANGDPEMTRGKLAEAFYDDYHIKNTGSSGFIGWFKMMLQNGISISRHGGKGLNLGWYFSLLLLLVEAGFAAWASMATAVSLLDEPYCERCFLWSVEAWDRTTTPEVLGSLVERLQPNLEPPHGALVDLPPGDPAGVHGKMLLRWCPKCREGYLNATLVSSSGNEKSEQIVIANLHLTPAELQTLTTANPAGDAAQSPATETGSEKTNS